MMDTASKRLNNPQFIQLATSQQKQDGWFWNVPGRIAAVLRDVQMKLDMDASG
jgi:hypothetical protein